MGSKAAAQADAWSRRGWAVMHKYVGEVLYCPTDLVRILGCDHATALDLLRLRDPESAPELDARAADLGGRGEGVGP
jgi:hypothetical protein